ncbi:protein kinase domain-containing protein [Nostoc sp.]|uniref:protein kinase domain-containing protein n=1 Tax=Nostoc sp. TaxID=1180 RepID=UPI002FF56D7E
MNEADVIKLLQEILQVLTFIHQQRVIHRDIKPSNIIRRLDGKIFLIDFGAVKQISTQIIQLQGQKNI